MFYDHTIFRFTQVQSESSTLSMHGFKVYIYKISFYFICAFNPMYSVYSTTLTHIYIYLFVTLSYNVGFGVYFQQHD